MGALVRSRNADRYRMLDVPGVHPAKLDDILEAYEDGSAAFTDEGEEIIDEGGNEVSLLDLQLKKLAPDEFKALVRFNSLLREGRIQGIGATITMMEKGDLPHAYNRSWEIRAKIDALLADILDTLP